MAIQKLILYKTFHGQELKFYIESPKVSEFDQFWLQQMKSDDSEQYNFWACAS